VANKIEDVVGKEGEREREMERPIFGLESME
jgi:hypothetical protein